MIKIRNLWKRFGTLPVLQGVNLDILEGESLVILGKSGVGKSVLLKHIMGLTKPDEGFIEVQGQRITDLTSEDLYKGVAKMGMLFQNGALFDSMSIEENVAFHLEQHGDPLTGAKYSKKEIADKVEAALEMVGLPGIQKKTPGELSGGMRKRIGLARLIIYKPSILLYDEPTTGLDPITSEQINNLIIKVQQELKATSVVVTHDLRSAFQIADRLALHENGQIIHINDKNKFLEIDHPLINFFKKPIT